LVADDPSRDKESSARDECANTALDSRPSHACADESEAEHGRVARPAIALVVTTAVLYLGKDILLPLALASILALVSSPVVNRLERFVGRLISATLLVVIALAGVILLAYFLSVELTSVAVELTAYSDNIADKLSSLQHKTPQWLLQVEDSVKDIERQLALSNPQKRRSNQTVTAIQGQSSVREMVEPALPLLTGIGDGLLVVALLFFLLYERKALRARFVRLAARSRVTIAAEAIDAAGEIVGQYLLIYALLNAGFGVAIGLVTWWFGLPHPWFWGVLSALFRFVPYVGAFTSALLPTAVAFAISPGWRVSLELLGSFIVFDQVLAQFVEPVLIGRGIGISVVALLISAMYWAWLWGPVGLILAVPMTACLKVAGDFIPALNFFSLLLGADNPTDGYQDFYRCLLERDGAGARELALRHTDEYGLEDTLDRFLTPAVLLVAEERGEDHVGEELGRSVLETIRELIPQLGTRAGGEHFASTIRALGFCAPDDPHSLGLLMLLEQLRRNGAIVRFLSDETMPEDIKERITNFSPHVVCISCTVTEGVANALQTVEMLNREFPGLMIIAGGRAAAAAFQKFLDAGCKRVCRDRSEGIKYLRLMHPYTAAPGTTRKAMNRVSGPAGEHEAEHAPSHWHRLKAE
jgi:predicted PurR-regulated permease PerM/methanogenic corrinoid protein MtbC1